jgi:5-methylcytosine-specific restriction endonuclease McrA
VIVNNRQHKAEGFLTQEIMNQKKRIRKLFRDVCLKRDNYRCVMCGIASSEEEYKDLDVHHINDRSLMPAGGYVKENGISLCSDCHLMAEKFHSTGEAYPGYAPEDLYARIGSSYEQALAASQKLKDDNE